MDLNDIQSSKENKRKQHQSPDYVSHETDKERTKKSHGHSSDRKKSRRVGKFVTWLFFNNVSPFIVSLFDCGHIFCFGMNGAA